MKVILNKDLATLGEEGDVKDVAKGYARNYLFPRGIALPYTPGTVKIFESRREEIDKRKEQKRQDSLGLKERLEILELAITMPAGANGKLYGAVTSQTIADELSKHGFQIERKRIELASSGLKSVGKYKAVIKLYENQSAEVQINIIAQEVKVETPQAAARPARRRREESTARTETEPVNPVEAAADTTASGETGEAVSDNGAVSGGEALGENPLAE
ncbi:MAG: 50S ribosomal protein L9 [Treponema sp.]|nr:50S ribosomal protein L9 [Treponema sp.]